MLGFGLRFQDLGFRGGRVGSEVEGLGFRVSCCSFVWGFGVTSLGPMSRSRSGVTVRVDPRPESQMGVSENGLCTNLIGPCTNLIGDLPKPFFYALNLA